MVGGGFIGLEVAEQFRRRGLDVALVELQPQVLPLLDPEMAEPLHRELEAHGVQLELGRGIASIEEKDGTATAVVLTDGSRLPADIVLLGLGVRPNVKLAVEAGLNTGASGGIATDVSMRTSDSDIYAVGDAVEYAYAPTGGRMRVPLAGPANRTGRLAGQHAANGVARPSPGAWHIDRASSNKRPGLRDTRCAPHSRQGLTRVLSISRATTTRAISRVRSSSTETGLRDGERPRRGARDVGGEGIEKRLDVIATVRISTVPSTTWRSSISHMCCRSGREDPVHMAAFARRMTSTAWRGLSSPMLTCRRTRS